MEERPEAYPYGEMDALKWAEEFKRLYPNSPEIDILLGWFANAIMTGWDFCKITASSKTKRFSSPYEIV